MNSPTHCLVAMALLSRKDDTPRNWAVLAGSVIPDAFIYLGWSWLTFVAGESQERIWNEIYFDAPMQLVASIFNSIPLYIGLALIGWTARAQRWGLFLMVGALAALSHIALDFPVHNHDAMRISGPVTDWRFISPLSYWEADHHADGSAWLRL